MIHAVQAMTLEVEAAAGAGRAAAKFLGRGITETDLQSESSRGKEGDLVPRPPSTGSSAPSRSFASRPRRSKELLTVPSPRTDVCQKELEESAERWKLLLEALPRQDTPEKVVDAEQVLLSSAALLVEMQLLALQLQRYTLRLGISKSDLEGILPNLFTSLPFQDDSDCDDRGAVRKTLSKASSSASVSTPTRGSKPRTSKISRRSNTDVDIAEALNDVTKAATEDELNLLVNKFSYLQDRRARIIEKAAEPASRSSNGRSSQQSRATNRRRSMSFDETMSSQLAPLAYLDDDDKKDEPVSPLSPKEVCFSPRWAQGAKRGTIEFDLPTSSSTGRVSMEERTRADETLTMQADALPPLLPVTMKKRRHSFAAAAAMKNLTDLLCAHIQGKPQKVYDLDKQLGAGTYGSVYLAIHKTTGQRNAVKMCPKSLLRAGDSADGGFFWDEIDIMKQLDHPHIMRLYCTFEDESNICISSELCEGGQLFDAIIEAGTLSEHIASRLFKQILSAVSYLHFKSICHRDLKPENFLLSRKVNLKKSVQGVKVKLIDFGTAKRFDLWPLTTKVCTLHYVAPEVLKRSMEPYTEKVDVWSCGVILFNMVSGSPPFLHETDVGLMKLVKKGKWSFTPSEIWAQVSDQVKSLITSMICVNPETRVSAKEAQSHEWFESKDKSAAPLIDFKTIMQMRCFQAANCLKKVALQIIARQISDDNIEKLRQIFLEVDTDNSGTLTVGEMEVALEKISVDENVKLEMRRLFADNVEWNSTGTIPYSEFIASTISRQTYMKDEVCRAAFHVFDIDGDGEISKNDLKKLLEHTRSEGGGKGLTGVTVEEVDEIMAEVDRNGDGLMSFDEFKMLMSSKNAAQGIELSDVKHVSFKTKS